ncbi:MAG: hypothetical protein J6U40_07815, partial [Kiritimatiellae bacterium]|nr:hypothetical protein [Kiritimatiellia bacterium]
FTDDPTKIGIPTFKSGAVWKEFVSNMNVYCNVDGVVTGTGLSGNIEFWPWNYHHTAKLNIGAELLAYDFDDEISTGGNYGSMQVHNYLAKQTIFAFNRFNDGAAPCLGIGNCETSDPEHLGYDWTFAENASDYTYRRLIVLVRPVADTTPPTVLAAKIGSAGTQLFVTFSEKIAKDTLSLSTFTSAGFTVEEYTFSEDGKTVNLKITPVDPAGGAVLSVAGARDLFGNVMDPAEITIEPYGIPDAVAANVGDALAGYEMVYAAEMGELGNFNNDPRAYWLDQSMATGKIDRVAYYFELEDYLGAKNYVFTSFDTPTQSRRLLGVPTAEKAIYFQQPVFNAFVKSSMGDLNLGSLPDGCNIEFWAGNYHNENEAGIPNATDDHYDFGDRMTYFPNQPGHGSMQVHCFTQSKTLWSLTNFGEDGHVLGVGWNNSNMNNHQDSWDWTFAENARNFLHRRLYIFVRPATDEEDPGKPEMAALAASLTAEIQAKIGEELTEGYRLIAASTNIPTMCYIRDAAWAAENFYAVDYRGTVPPSSFDRVAYFIQYQDTDDAEPKYIWTSMDTFAPSVQQLCVPTGGYYFQKSVSNLDVASNAGNITSGTGIETGCIEFWASNYGVRNSVAEWGGSDSAFDWNDSEMNTGIGHGSMQVHNYGAGEVLWAFNNFNKNNASDAPCFGIGNNPYGSDLDWTFTTRVAQYRNMRLCILVRETASQEKLDETIKAEIAERVGDSVLAGFETLFAITNVPPQCQMNQPYWAPNLLAIDNRFKYGDGSFSRVAYFMEVQFSHEESPRYVLVVMDPFTDKGYQFGIPIGGYAFQKRVEHMDVYTNDPHITPGRDIATGCIEFWASNYGNGNSANGWGGSGGIFDWDDTGWSDARGGHGSMQIHNYGAREILICFNHFNGNNMPGLGVGQNQNVTNADLDYTFTYNSDQYQRIRFVCMILPAPESFPDKRPTPAVKRVISARSGDLLAVRFDQPLSQSVLDTVSFDLDGDIEVKGISRYDDQTLIVSVSPMTPGEAYTLYYENAIGIGGGAADGSFDFRALSTAEATAPTCLRGVDEVADYRLIYRLALPDVRRDIYADTPYLVDEEYFFAGQSDRIGYCMELTTANNVAKWVWVSMDAFTPNIANIAVPAYDRGMMFQQVVGNMNVFASPNAGVTTGVGIQTGNIEFWPSNYN